MYDLLIGLCHALTTLEGASLHSAIFQSSHSLICVATLTPFLVLTVTCLDDTSSLYLFRCGSLFVCDRDALTPSFDRVVQDMI